MIPLLLAACAPMDVSFHGKDPVPSPATSDTADSGPAPDTDTAPDTADTDTSVPVEETCPTAWPDRSLATHTCTTLPETEWSLIEKDRAMIGSNYDLSVGRFFDDDGDGDIDDDDRPAILTQVGVNGRQLLNADLDFVDVYALGAYFTAQVAIGRLDPARDGVQFIVNYWPAYGEPDHLSWNDPDEYRDLPAGWSNSYFDALWLTDLEGDGQPELLLREAVWNAADGTLLTVLEGEMANPIATADLDLDGIEEILGTKRDGTTRADGFWASDGTWQAACLETTDPAGMAALAMFAIGDLDGDPEGEFVATAGTTFAVCDSDGSPIVQREFGTWLRNPALGDLDGDGLAEVVIADRDRLLALEPDGTTLWEVPMESSGPPSMLADLDGDGDHELVVQSSTNVLILDGDGAILTSYPWESMNTLGSPLVVDLDRDGLSEIVAPSTSGILVLTTPRGGFAAPAPQEIWSNHIGIHPGDRLADGTVPGPRLGVHWASPETNVWQGMASGLGNTFPDLTVESVEVCVLDCEGTGTVAVYVGNAGERALDADVTVRLASVADGTVLAEGTLAGPHEPGVARAAVLEVPASALDGDLAVSLSHGSVFPECDVLANVSVVAAGGCP